MESAIEILVGDVTDMEARVYARYSGPASAVLSGAIRGPYCETAHTLPAEFPFRASNVQERGWVEAVITDPCMWSAEMPHVYRVDVQAIEGERVVAEYHGTIGLQRLAPRRPVDFAPGTG